MCPTDDRTDHIHDQGRIHVRSARFDCAWYQHTIASKGRFETRFGQHAVMVSPTAPAGSLSRNGRLVPAQRSAGPVYSIWQPNDRIEGHLEADLEHEIVLLCPQFVENFLDREFAERHVHLAAAVCHEMPPLMQFAWRRLKAAANEPGGAGSARFCLCLELLLAKLVEPQLGVTNAAAAGANHESLTRAIEFIDTHIGDRIDVRSIAAAAQLSPNYFSRVFENAYRTSVHRFVLDRRLQRARTLLVDSTLPISQIALELGFCSQSHLTTTFRHRFGETPAQCRVRASTVIAASAADDE